MERDGRRFTVTERTEMRQRAWHLRHHQHLPQQQIAAKLNVSQATVSNWLKAMAPPPGQQRAADRIRAELVCCDIYQRMEDVSAPGQEDAWNKLRHSSNYHGICFYGEWSARIAEQTQ